MSAVPQTSSPPTVSSLVTIDLANLSQVGVLELLRAAAGITYEQIAGLSGISPQHATCLLRGINLVGCEKTLAVLRDALWDRLPAVTAAPQPSSLAGAAPADQDFYTVDELANMLHLKPATIRDLARTQPDLGAIRVMSEIRFPADKLRLLFGEGATPRPGAPRDLLTISEAAALLSVAPSSVSRACRVGSIQALQARRKGSWRIPRSEISRILTGGTHDRRRLAPVDPECVTMKQAAQILRVSLETIRYAIEKGRIRASQSEPHGRVRIPREEIERLKTEGTGPVAPTAPGEKGARQ